MLLRFAVYLESLQHTGGTAAQSANDQKTMKNMQPPNMAVQQSTRRLGAVMQAPAKRGWRNWRNWAVIRQARQALASLGTWARRTIQISRYRMWYDALYVHYAHYGYDGYYDHHGHHGRHGRHSHQHSHYGHFGHYALLRPLRFTLLTTVTALTTVTIVITMVTTTPRSAGITCSRASSTHGRRRRTCWRR